MKLVFKDVYGLDIYEVNVLAEQGRKKVWGLQTSKGKKVWKRIPSSNDRAGFMIRVMEYLISKGIKVPRVIKTRFNKNYYLSSQGEIYLLTDWVDGIKPNFNDHLKEIVITLAKFHKYTAKIEANPSSVFDWRGIWPATYEKRQKRLSEIKQALRGNNEVSGGLLKSIDYFLKKSKSAANSLENSYYHVWLRRKGAKTGLCHRDFIPQNLSLTGAGELCIFDFDTLTMDIPAMDLRKLINTCCKEKGKWDVEIVKSVVNFYNSVNPLLDREWEVVFIDLMFPHFFYSLLNKYYTESVQVANYNIERIHETILFEKSKKDMWKDFQDIMGERGEY
ncbi:spore coat protein, CotS family [Desulfofarcimen acetoxidans DSM 771]|uniref:Spore coat protein, CotS family n=2 Tax=Desulfofarcimen acetoxidans TaxID=58138 RepID=C8W4E8_DESAS|nr:spore coat protein, CotS family [Desulfofarcimen acetoxidans DSM 771]